MKTYNYFYNGQPIQKSAFLNNVPDNWENDLDENMTILQKNIQLLKERLLSYAEKNLYSGFSETLGFEDIMTSAFSSDEIDNIYEELDEAGELDFLLKREFMFLEKGKINELYYLLESEKINIISEMEEITPEYES